ncbi:NOC3p-domain-containing protein [Coemansia reversa NRRL 1564]|uniref:NOC3p-domain-containing protein n=1 Tax=Coemansia reversa (strain ATCC 12441 / NRRL 1564) TaxID=763665 RepID=A0A2G5BE92_COERN|nr:NOC3p-domain-containing protein [Coemansia reversa NRRL 1564]|eukprot:PIA17312.1 NOC3p-domain-containing protein [Coemansia reversa NRRL 1564]
MNYEQNLRRFEQTEKKPKLTNRLPIKTADGRLALPENSDEENDDISDSAHTDGESSVGGEQSAEEQHSTLEVDSDGDEDQEVSTRPSYTETKLEEQDDYVIEPDRSRMTRKQYIIAQQNRLAVIADAIMQDPDNGVKYLKTLHNISSDVDPRVKRLGLLTQLAVFCDILPEYRIRELTEKEQQAKVTKDVRQQRMHEEQLVHSYSNYLKQLFTASKQALKVFANPSADIETGIVAARALGNLINVRPLFNFRKDILSALVDIYTARLAVLRLFRDDVSGELSQNAVMLAAKRIKRLSYRVDPSALRPWLHLRLREELRENPEDRKRKDEEQRQREQPKRALHMSKKQAKMRKVQQDVDKSLVEAEAEVSREEREKWYGETLKQVFITYFRILKQKDNIGGLLPAVLEGLAKYAHLISVEFFVDLFQLLKKIMRGQHGVGIGAEESEHGEDLVSSRVGLRTALLCILSALHILTGQGEALNLDIKDFFYQLYALLPPLAARPQIEATQATWEETVRSESDLLFECLQLMFLGRTKVSSITRVAAFCKRIAECALCWPPKTAVRAIEFMHRLLIKYPALDRLLSSEEQAGCGLYLRDLDDPDMCNPFATCLFELHWLQIHYHAGVQAATARLLNFAKTEQKKHRL